MSDRETALEVAAKIYTKLDTVKNPNKEMGDKKFKYAYAVYSLASLISGELTIEQVRRFVMEG